MSGVQDYGDLIFGYLVGRHGLADTEAEIVEALGLKDVYEDGKAGFSLRMEFKGLTKRYPRVRYYGGLLDDTPMYWAERIS